MSEDAWRYPEATRTQAERERDYQLWRQARREGEQAAALRPGRASDAKSPRPRTTEEWLAERF